MPDTRINYQVTVTSSYTYSSNTFDFQVYVPEGFQGKPKTELEILVRAKALLEEEGRWMTGEWFKNEHPNVDPEDAYCNNWGVCMDGALISVSAGVGRINGGSSWQCFDHIVLDHRFGEAYTPQLRGARQLLVDAGIKRYPIHAEDVAVNNGYDSAEEMLEAMSDAFDVPSFNDSVVGTRTEAIAWLDDAIALASNQENTNV